ncbi:FadR/GntR family transcriptional regulator [Actinoplanes sp. CA-030573]|uniref:FadR/GntR family transcriptional regulator n=1 Tax=Actinoplanes sp. CA-030573 TaxID=3239898 RepID=UPI003D93C58E
MAVTDDAIEKIKSMIVTGELRPGDRLPRETDLARRLGLSRNSLREAVKALSLVRVLDVRQGDGTYVTSLAPQLPVTALELIVDLHQDETVVDLFEVRRILEPAAAALSAQRMTEDDIVALGRVLAGLGEEASIDELVAQDVDFHHRIAVGRGTNCCAL